MPRLCSAHAEPKPGCDLCAADPGDTCDVCGVKLKVGDKIQFKLDGTAFYHVGCLRPFEPKHFGK